MVVTRLWPSLIGLARVGATFAANLFKVAAPA